MAKGQSRSFPNNYRALLLLGFLMMKFLLVNGQAVYNPAQQPFMTFVVNKPFGQAQANPTDARSYKADTINLLYRPFNGTAEVLSYFPVTIPKYRTGQFPIEVNIGGALQSNGTFIGGQIFEYWWRNGQADSQLVLKAPVTFSTAGLLQAANNLSDLGSIITAKVNLALDQVNNTSDATKNAATATLTNKTISGTNNTFSNIPNSALTNSSIGLTLDNAGSSPAVSPNPAALGTSIGLHVPIANGTNTGFIANTDWTVHQNKVDSTLLAPTLDSVFDYHNGTKVFRYKMPPGTGAVNSVNNADPTMVFTPSTGNVLGRVNLASTFAWTGLHSWTAAPSILSLTSNGGPLYTNGSGTIQQVPAGTTSQILQGGTSPSFFTPTLNTVSGWLGFTPIASVISQNSVIGNGLSGTPLQFQNDLAAAPTAGFQYNYGFDSTGTRNFYLNKYIVAKQVSELRQLRTGDTSLIYRANINGFVADFVWSPTSAVSDDSVMTLKAVPGTGRLIRYYDNSILVDWFIPNGINGHDGNIDNSYAIQKAMNFAATSGNAPDVNFLGGNYACNDIVVYRKSGTEYPYVSFKIKGQAFGSAYATHIFVNNANGFGFMIQTGYQMEISNIWFTGKLTPPSGLANYILYTDAQWGTGLRINQYSPHAGLVIDGLSASITGANQYPGMASYYTNTGAGGTSLVTITNCVFERFWVGVAHNLTPSSLGNGDNIKITGGSFTNNDCVFAPGYTQNRGNQIENCYMTFNRYIINGTLVGAQNGTPPTIKNCNIAGFTKYLYQLNTGFDHMSIVNTHAESVFALGISATEPIEFTDSHIYLMIPGSGVFSSPHIAQGPMVSFKGGSFGYFDNTYKAVIPMNVTNLSFNGVYLRGLPVSLGLSNASANYAQQTVYDNCTFAGYVGLSGTGQAWEANNFYQITPNNFLQQIIMPGTKYTDLEATVDPGKPAFVSYESYGPKIDYISLGSYAVTIDSVLNKIRFTPPTGLFKVGDAIASGQNIAWSGDLLASVQSWLGQVDSVYVGTTTDTVKLKYVPYGVVSGATYDMNIVRIPIVEPKMFGNITNGSTAISNIRQQGGSPWAVGYIIKGPGIPSGARLTSISGSTATLSLPATATATNVEFQDAPIKSISSAPDTANLTSTIGFDKGDIVYNTKKYIINDSVFAWMCDTAGFMDGHLPRAHFVATYTALKSAGVVSPNWINVVNSGADNTGATDVTSLINTLQTSGNKNLYFPPGSYAIKELKMLDSVFFRGDGMKTKFIVSTNDTILTTGNYDRITGVTFIGNAGTTAQIAINADKTIGTYVNDCRFINMGVGIRTARSAQRAGSGIRIGNVFSDLQGYNNNIGAWCDVQGEYNSFSNVHFPSSLVYGFKNAAGNNYFDRCDADSSAIGFYLQGGTNDAHSSLVNSHFNHCYQKSFYSQNVANGFQVVGSAFYYARFEIDTSVNIVIQNSFIDCTGDSLVINTVTQSSFSNVIFPTTPTLKQVGTNTVTFNSYQQSWDRSDLTTGIHLDDPFHTKHFNIHHNNGVVVYGGTDITQNIWYGTMYTGNPGIVFSNGAGSSTVNSTTTNKLQIGTGQVQFTGYGAGTFTGTATKSLNVDASGNIIEGTVGGGSQTLQQVFGVQSNRAILTASDTVTNTGQTFVWNNGWNGSTGLFKFNGVRQDTANLMGVMVAGNDSSMTKAPWATFALKLSPYLPTDTTTYQNGLNSTGTSTNNTVEWGTAPLLHNTTLPFGSNNVTYSGTGTFIVSTPLQITTGSGDRKVLTSDASGNASWVNFMPFTQTASGTALTNSTTPTDLSGTGIGSTSIPANTLHAGDVVVTHMTCLLSTAAAPGTLTISSMLGNGITFTPAGTLSLQTLDITIRTTILTTGTSGTYAQEIFTILGNVTSSSTNANVFLSTTINTTISNNFSVQGTWGTANASNSIQSTAAGTNIKIN